MTLLLTRTRLILYFPVSALVTLFANILQNPQDPRARADVKLMNLVVNFLSLLVSDEENGSVKRMLNVCAVYERIAKVVLDKADKESHSRRKRKTAAEEKGPTDTKPSTAPLSQAGKASTDSPAAHHPSSVNTPTSQPLNPATIGNVYSPPSGFHEGELPSMPDSYNDFSDFLSNNSFNPGYGDLHNMPASMPSPLNVSSFQQPFVPQDLWQMPMTLEWDWADMTGGPSFDQNDPTMGLQ